MTRSRAAIGTAVLTSTLTSLAMLAGAPSATAATASEPIATGLAGPLQMDIDTSGGAPRIVVGQAMSGVLSEVNHDGVVTDLHAEEGAEISGVAIKGKKIAFLTTVFDHDNPAAFLKVLRGDGKVVKVANLQKFEERVNPDRRVKYGVRGLKDGCEKKLPEHVFSPYKGIVESHPYAVANAPGGGWYVADAAGNTILKVNAKGKVKVVAVLPRQKVIVTEGAAEANDLPKCAVDAKAFFEGVPTDIEVAEDGSLLVSLLPGGPEDGSFGATGKVVSVDPKTGKSTMVAKGFAAATNVAIGDGSVFVSELFGSKVTEIDGEGATTYWEGPMPAAVEYANGYLYAAIDVFNPEGGSIVTLYPDEVTRD